MLGDALSHIWAVVVATLLWLMAWATTVLLILTAVVPLAIILGLLRIPYPEWGVTALFLAGPIFLIAFLTTPAVRFGLRISPLPAGKATRQRIPLALALAWALALTLAVINGAEWQSFFTLGVAGPVAAWRLWKLNRDWEGMPTGKFVLFLRRFGKSADRLVGSAIRRAVPQDAALAFLVGKENTGESWDPFLIGYDGLSGGTGAKAIPLYHSAKNEEWVERVQALVVRANAIVIDMTDRSAAMEIEGRIISESSAESRTIVLTRGEHCEIPAGANIAYRRSWRAAFERIFWGFVGTVLMPLVIHATATSREYPDLVLAIPLLALWTWLFVRPLMDRESAEALKTALNQLVSK